MNQSPKRICDVAGYQAAGVVAGIKSSGKKDLALIYSELPAKGAAVFTTNLVKAAPVLVSQEHIGGGTFRAVVMSSGNANAATGEEGVETVREMCKIAAAELKCLPREVLIAQTGLIGVTLDREAALSGVKKAAAALSSTGSNDAAEAIMTTDTKPKHAAFTFEAGGREVTLAGIAKGAAMLSPSMATMLALVVSDVAVAKEVMDHALRAAMEDSFHVMVVDGSRSTNDTVFLLANGEAKNPLIDSIKHPDYRNFEIALTETCKALAMQMAADAEGATKFFKMRVVGARNKAAAQRAARSVVSSVLVKCSLAGENAYWGRVISELGASGVDFDPNEVEIKYGDFTVCKNGMAFAHDEDPVRRYMSGREIIVTAKIGDGQGDGEAYGCDLTHAYLDENMAKS